MESSVELITKVPITTTENILGWICIILYFLIFSFPYYSSHRNYCNFINHKLHPSNSKYFNYRGSTETSCIVQQYNLKNKCGDLKGVCPSGVGFVEKYNKWDEPNKGLMFSTALTFCDSHIEIMLVFSFCVIGMWFMGYKGFLFKQNEVDESIHNKEDIRIALPIAIFFLGITVIGMLWITPSSNQNYHVLIAMLTFISGQIFLICIWLTYKKWEDNGINDRPILEKRLERVVYASWGFAGFVIFFMLMGGPIPMLTSLYYSKMKTKPNPYACSIINLLNPNSSKNSLKFWKISDAFVGICEMGHAICVLAAFIIFTMLPRIPSDMTFNIGIS
jgi:hypothetical protein